MGGVTKVVSKIGDAVGDAVEDVGDALGVGGGGGSAAPAPKPTPANNQLAAYKALGEAVKTPSANADARAQVAEGLAAVRPKVDEVMQRYDLVNQLDPVAPGGFASPIDPGVISPGGGGFFGGATTGFPDFVTNSQVLPEEGYQYVDGGSDPANIQPIPQTSPYEAATTFGLSNPAANERFTPTPFQRPEQMGGAPLSPEQAMVFARQAAQRPMQRFAAGGSVRPMQQGVGSLMNYIKRG